MNNSRVINVSNHSARILSYKHLETWSAAGALHREELIRIVKEITLALYRSTSPAKTLNAALKKLEGLFSQREVRGEVLLHNNRHINFRLAFPTNASDKLLFSLLYGEINARTGAVKFDLTTPIQISLHALQRLFERLEESSEDLVLDEIYSCIGQAIHWHKGSSEIEAKCWPLLSKNGFFVGTTQSGSLTTNIVTWIQGKYIGRKWGLPLSNLLRLRDENPKQLENSDFAKEFVRSFPWMLFEHVPGEDIMSIDWDRQGDEESEAKNTALLSAEKSPKDPTDEQALDRKISVSYIAGLNYKKTSPPFKTHTLHHGFVVQQRVDGHLIVGLRNGWVGQIPRRSIDRGFNIISNYTPPKIGDEISVLVHKITHFPDEGAYAISLDPKDVSDANWAAIEKQHPVGSFHSATIEVKYNQEFMSQLENGVRGAIPADEIKVYSNQPVQFGCSPIGQTIEVVVTGYRAEKKCLLLSIRNIEFFQIEQEKYAAYKAGELVWGKCTRSVSNYALIELPRGASGLLHNLNNWGDSLPAEGEDVNVIVIAEEDSQLQLGGIPKRALEKIFHAYPLSEEKWEHFIIKYKEGDVVDIQVLFWREKTMWYMVATSDGIVGMMPSSEISWLHVSQEERKILFKPGDILKAMIVKIQPEKKRVVFSKKALDKNPIDDELAKIQINDSYLGIIVNVLDYGCFVQLEPSGIQALLHRTKIPENTTFKKGETINACVDSVDFEKKRIGIRLTDG
jgi:predicted RNA-binding protein with RPS1 domain